ncbi:MAG: dockerin type I domain-containing protein, partial [candidate division Zixibacteria bacterium]|nr:dockerin type I domain-containing protein [candidate division Zixibacteria bacterium]
MIDAAQRVTNLEAIYAGQSTGSDDHSFSSMGYNVVLAIEPNPRLNPNYHRSSDIPDNINFEYMTRIVRMAAAGIGQVENMPSPVAIDHIYDVGDGQSLQVVWENDCQPDYLYKVLYGIQWGLYTDTVDLPAGECICNITGLTEGQIYYVAVMPINAGGHSPIVLKESGWVSWVNPRVPFDFAADPDTGRIILTWQPNQELDINHYRLMRKDTASSWRVLMDNLNDIIFIDHTPEPHMAYGYYLIAVDNQGNESQGSPVSNAVMATFDGGILFVDETRSGTSNPTEAQQTAFYDSIFTGTPYFKYNIDNSNVRLSRSLAGQYSSIFWIDDDLASKQLAGSLDSLQWYLGYNGNLFLAGLGTFDWISGATSFLRNNFGILGVIGNQAGDFIEATGVNGWPSIQVGTGKLFSGAIPWIATFDTLPGAQVIYTYNSQSFNPALTGKPVGVAYDTPHGKRIALSFPIYYLTESSAQALIAKALNYFGEAGNPRPYGDANGDGFVTMVDVFSLIDYLYRNGSLPSDLNYADANGDCIVNIRDITYIIRYLFKGGPAPVAGCVHQ